MSCNFNDHIIHLEAIVAPAYQNHPNGNIVSLSTTGYNNFGQAMWNGFLNNGCAFFDNRIDHFTNQLNTQTFSPYQQQIKQAKLNYCTAMRIKCGCPLPPVAPQPIFTPVGQQAKTNQEIIEQGLNDTKKEFGKEFKYTGEKVKDLENE